MRKSFSVDFYLNVNVYVQKCLWDNNYMGKYENG